MLSLLVTGLSLFAFDAKSQTARIQVIHNSADAAADEVDVYLGSTLFLNDFPFREATPFVDAPAGVPIVIGVAPSNSTSVNDTIESFTVTLTANETYVVVANGIVSPTGYSPAPAFDLNIYAMGREEASTTGNTDILVCHGSTDAPTVDVQAIGIGTIVNDLQYGTFQGYLEVPTADLIINVADETGATVVATYSAPLQTLGLEDSALVVVASGFLDPSSNSNGPAFGLYVALPNGGPLVPLPSETTPEARVQVIHNSADLVAEMVDVYLNDGLLLDDFEFRTATPFVDIPAELPIRIGIAPANSTGIADTITSFTYTLDENETYIIVANGIVSTSGYSPLEPFNLYVFPMARESGGNPNETDILVFHGSTDAPTVDVQVRGVGTVVDDLMYGDFDGYLNVTTADITLDITDQTGTNVIAAYEAPLQTLGLNGEAITVLASGFVDSTQNSNGASFGLWVALAAGGNLVELPTAAIGVNEYVKIPITLFPNPAKDEIRIAGLEDNNIYGDLEIIDMAGVVVKRIEGFDQNSVRVNELPAGQYVLRIVNEGKLFQSRFNKQ